MILKNIRGLTAGNSETIFQKMTDIICKNKAVRFRANFTGALLQSTMHRLDAEMQEEAGILQVQMFDPKLKAFRIRMWAVLRGSPGLQGW